MQFEIENHLLSNVQYVPSPNQSDRPPGTDIDLLVIHNISLPPGEFGGDGIERLFTNCLETGVHPCFEELADLRVSAHLLIRRDGECVQFVPFHRRAWHAGVSTFAQRENCNDYSIGIELEGTDDLAYADVQYERLGRVVAALLTTYPRLDAGRMVGHCDIAPERKTDPGAAFDWHRFKSMIHAASTE